MNNSPELVERINTIRIISISVSFPRYLELPPCEGLSAFFVEFDGLALM